MMIRHVLVLGASVGIAALAACAAPAITWDDVQYPGRAVIPTSELTVPATPAGACPGSVRAAVAAGATYAAWWAVRPDSSAVLMAGRSTDGGHTWPVTVPADTMDRSRRGCARPAPAVSADSATNYLDVAFFLEPADGAGIFFTHTMDATHLGTPNAVFHAPVPVMYGEHPARVAVTSRGGDVAVAYEDPNAEQPMVGVALSHTMGHLFAARALASQSELPATDPRVALAPDTVVVQWAERPDSVATGGRIAVRRGRWGK